MLVIDDNSVYEIDEKCMQKRNIPKGCQIYEKIQKKEIRVGKKEPDSYKQK